jgi:hypothetical protein
MVEPSDQAPILSPELPSMLRSSRGAVLVEMLVALAILSAAGLALLELVTEGLRAERDARERERVVFVGARVLTALTLLKREDLDRRLGRHPIGELIADVERPEPTLYRIAITRSASPEVEDLATVVYRPEAARAP